MKVEVFVVSAFGMNESGGNPAGIVLDAKGLSDSQMLQIAAKVGLSETAFLFPSDVCDFRLRFFTPVDEVDLCGHATIATYSLLHQLGKVSAGHYRQELLAGKLDIAIGEDGLISMEQSIPNYGDTFPAEDIALLVGTNSEEISIPNYPIQLVSTGLRDVLVPIRSREALANLQPDFKAMAEFNKNLDSVGFHAFWLNAESSEPTAICRNFAPLYEIDEEAATGSSSGALASYLFKHGVTQEHFEFHQGLSMGRPSKILVNLEASDDTISRVVVSGYAGKPTSIFVGAQPPSE